MLSKRPSTALSFREASTGSASVGTLIRFCLARAGIRQDTGRNKKPEQEIESGSAGGWAALNSFFGPALCGPALCGAFGLFLAAALPASTESAVANGDTRTLNLYDQHTKESIAATYRVNGHYDPAVLEKLNWFLRDWRHNEATHMDPRLFDAVWETYREAGATAPIVVVCGYRSPQTNAMLRRRSRMVARHSQHILGKAMDTEMPGMSMEKVREIAMRLEMGGVGFYGDSSFIHIDVGGIRYWPRMSYAQLARVFPDGKTVLIPTNGKPLPGYEEARAEIAASGRVADVPPSEKGQNFFAWLFGLAKGGADEHEEEAAQAVATNREAPAARAVAEAAPAAAQERRAAEKPMQMAANAAKDADAATDKGASIDRDMSDTIAPVPPPRPDEFLALADVPLPPNRPAAAALVMAALQAHAANQSPIAARAANLPAIITHGASEDALARQESQQEDQRRNDPQILAYAPVAQMQGLRSAVRNKARRGADKSAWATAAGKIEAPSRAEIAKLEKELVLSPTLTGLRQTARIETAELSHKLAAGYLARFASVATNLPTNRFSGPAVVGLRMADRSRMVFVDHSIAMKDGD